MYSRFTSAIILTLAFSAGAFGQSGAGLASISGTVLDPSGAHVPNAEVVISNENQGLVRSLQTNGEGVFNAPALPPSPEYRVKVTAAGFADYENNAVSLQVGQTLNLTVTLPLPQSTTVVELGAAATPVQDTKTDVPQVIDSTQILDLPTNG